MLKISVKVDVSRALRKLEIAKTQVPFATALALTRTAQAVKSDLQAAMRSIFKNPRKFTINSLAVKKATKSSLTSTVYVRSPSVERALYTEIMGGQRDRAVEKLLIGILPSGYYAVPASGAKLGSDGKLSLNWVSRIVQSVSTGNVSSKAPRRRSTSTNGGYFALPERDGRLPPGLYQRKGLSVLPLIIFVSKASYQARFDFYGIGTRSARTHFPQEFRKAAADAMASARR